MSATDEKTMELAIAVSGEILSSNFEDFKAQALERIDGMKYELLTDGDFAKAKEDIKRLSDDAKVLKAAKEQILKQLDDVYELMGGMDEIISAADDCRLGKSREVKKRDAEIRAKIIDDALNMIDHPKREKYRQQVADGAKGKRSFKTMADGSNKVATGINDSILKTRVVLEQFTNEHGNMLIPDITNLELQDAEGVASELKHRLQKQRDEEEKARLKAEAAKAQKEAQEAKAKAQGQSSLVDTEETLNLTPAKVDSIPVSNTSTPSPQEELTEADEFAALKRDGRNVLLGLKELFEGLKHSRNIELADAFRKQVNDAWVKMVEGGAK